MKNPSIEQYIFDMKIHCGKIIDKSLGLSYDDIMEDENLRFALERLFEIVGEAANRVPKEYRDTYSNIPWGKVIGLRNIIAHGYDKLNYELLLSTAIDDMPKLKIELDKIKLD